MRFSPRLIHKLLALIALPLLFEVIFAASLFALVRDAEVAGEREHRAREAVASLNSIYEHVMDASKVAGFVLFGKANSPQLQQFHMATATIPSDIENIRHQLEGDKQAVPQVDALDRNLQVVLRIMDEVFDQMQSGNRMGAVQHLRDVKSALVDVSDQLMTLRESCNRQADEDFDSQGASRRKTRTVITGGIIINVLMALLLLSFLNGNITSRLSMVITNAHRLAGNQPLLPDVGGTDEISHLDRTFKDMAVALEMAKRKERAVIETMPAGLIITDERGVVQMANPTMVKMLGLTSKALDFKAVSTILVGVHNSKPSAFLQFAEAATGKIVETEAVCDDGSRLPVEVSSTRFTVYGLNYHLFVLLDITERRQIEKMKEDFVAMISHDLRTPLSSIQLFVGMLGQGMYGAVSDTIAKKAVVADRNASRLISMINDLLDIDKIESGKLKLVCAQIQLRSLIDQAVDAVKGLADEHSVNINTAGVTNVAIHADGERLIQVLINLLGNAIKFSPRDSLITIASECLSDGVTIKITDNGRGVPEALRQAIFERFKQAQPGDAIERKGSGLGLAISKAIVEQHGGKIGVFDAAGGGSTFWFTIPLQQPIEEMEPLPV